MTINDSCISNDEASDPQKVIEALRLRLQQETEKRQQAEKRYQEAYYAYEKKFLSAFMYSPVPMTITTLDDNVFMDVNESFLQLVGRPRGEVLGMGIESVIDLWRLRDNYQQFLEEFDRHNRVHNFETEYRLASGATGFALISSELIPVNSHTLVLSTIQEISQRKQLEKSLRSLADRLMTINDIQHNLLSAQSPESVANVALAHLSRLIPYQLATVYRYDGGLNHALVLASTAAADSPFASGKTVVCPYDGRKLPGSVQPIYYVPDLTKLPDKKPHYQLVLDEGMRSFIFVLFVVKDEVLGALQLGTAEPNAYTDEHLNIVREVTHLLTTAVHQANLREALNTYTHKLEEKVQERTAELHLANAELARANRLKDEFLANMSHELRTPLTSILAKSEAFQEGVFGPINEKQRRSIQVIEQSGRHLLALINDILDLAKIGAGYMELRLTPASVFTVCEASLAMVRDMAWRKQINITQSEIDPALMLEADPQRLKQMLVNLLSNAVKFTAEGGHVGLDVIVDEPADTIRFVVWDTGIGIDAEKVGSLFTPFVQLDGSLARQYEGTGLGLALVSRLTRLHGGTVSVESEVGRGSRFTISLPLNRPAGEVVAETAVANNWYYDEEGEREETAETRPFHILLVEDNLVTAETLADYLEHLSYPVSVAYNGQMALDKVEEEPPDLILMDVQMPGMDGLEAMRRLRAHPARNEIPIIAVTALAMPGDEERCLEAGADEYISKPIAIVKLRGLIQKYERMRHS